jgi:shikimate dehydrogenase
MTDRYAVIGNPVAHSRSPAIHAEFARQTGEDIAYSAILAPLDGFKATVQAFRNAGGRGLNVTLPFKHEAWNLVNRHDDCALNATAVNTIKFEGELSVGFNTDGIGLLRDIRDNLRRPIKASRVLLMGAGGATYGVMEPLLRERPEQLVIANRTLDKATRLVEHFQRLQGAAMRVVTAGPYDALGNVEFDIVINATSAGLTGAMPPLPRGSFAPGALAYEMVYGRITPFMEFAGKCGARVADGLGMLVEQAAESFFIWRGVRPQTAPVIELLRRKAEG